ncbi:MAG: STAS domain-containing protein [Sedimentisphaerales bacterium]|nr:STAS domain-containing protein [Sedimentisphaerales bacterium]
MTEQTGLHVRQREDVSVVEFTEPMLLDAYHIQDSSKQLYALIEKHGLRRLVLDLSTIRMLSSQSLGVFLSMRQKLETCEGKMVLSGIDPRLSRVFKITNLQNVFEFYPDTDAAVESFQSLDAV